MSYVVASDICRINASLISFSERKMHRGFAKRAKNQIEAVNEVLSMYVKRGGSTAL